MIPCLNEAATIEKSIANARDAIRRTGMEGELIVADNGSTDGSDAIAERLGCRIVRVAKRGYGRTLRRGIEEASGDYILFGDADATYDFCEAVPMLDALREREALVTGTRIKGHIQPGAMPFLHRYIGNPFMTFLVNRFFQTDTSDVFCGLRAFSKKTFEKMQLTSDGMEFTCEMTIRAGMLNLPILEFPCSLGPQNPGRTPHLNTWMDGARCLVFVCRCIARRYFSRVFSQNEPAA